MSKSGYIQRYLLIIRIVRNNRYISLEELIRKVEDGLAYFDDSGNVGASRRTILRDIKEIRSWLNLSIEYSRQENGYYIPEDEDQTADIERILEQYDLMTSMHAREELSSIVFPERRKARGTEHLNPLIHAIKHSLMVDFDYVKFDNATSRRRHVMPYALKESRGRWYLLAIESGDNVRHAGEIKSWGLDRIRDLSVSKTRFSKDPSVDPEKEFRDVFGACSNSELPVEDVVLSFSPKSGRYNDAFPLHESQETLVDDGREFRIRLRVKLTLDFIQELLSQSEDLVVISPKHLRKELRDIYKKAMKRME